MQFYILHSKFKKIILPFLIKPYQTNFLSYEYLQFIHALYPKIIYSKYSMPTTINYYYNLY